MPFGDTKRPAEFKPVPVYDLQGVGPHLWEYNFISDTAGNCTLTGIFVTRRGRWVKFTGLVATNAAKSIIKMCTDSSVTWSDSYVGMIITVVGTNGFFYAVGANYDITLDAGGTADSTCPRVVTGTYHTAPIVVGRIFRA